MLGHPQKPIRRSLLLFEFPRSAWKTLPLVFLSEGLLSASFGEILSSKTTRVDGFVLHREAPIYRDRDFDPYPFDFPFPLPAPAPAPMLQLERQHPLLFYPL